MSRLFLLLAVWMPCTAWAASSIDTLKAMFAQTTTARAHFAQIVLDRNMKMLQQATGTMQFSRPGRFRWEYDRPYEQTIVSDGSKVWLYDKDQPGDGAPLRPRAGQQPRGPAGGQR